MVLHGGGHPPGLPPEDAAVTCNLLFFALAAAGIAAALYHLIFPEPMNDPTTPYLDGYIEGFKRGLTAGRREATSEAQATSPETETKD